MPLQDKQQSLGHGTVWAGRRFSLSCDGTATISLGRQVDGVGQIVGLGQLLHRADLLPGVGLEAGPVQEDWATSLVASITGRRPPRSNGIGSRSCRPRLLVRRQPQSSLTPSSSNQRVRPASRAANASASVSGRSSSTCVPPSCNALATKPKSSCTPISIQPYPLTHLAIAGKSVSILACSDVGRIIPTRRASRTSLRCSLYASSMPGRSCPAKTLTPIPISSR